MEDSKEFSDDKGIPFPLLSDPKLQVISAYGVAMEGGEIAVPATFVITQKKTVHWKHVGETMADRPDSTGLLKIAENAR